MTAEHKKRHNKATGSHDGKGSSTDRVELLLRKHPAVQQSAFFRMPDPTLGEKAYALVQLRDEAKLKEHLIIPELATLLKDAGIPYDRLSTFEQIPMDPRHQGKVEYQLLRDTLAKQEPGAART